MTGTVRLTYDEMFGNCTSLKTYADDYESTAQNVTSLISAFTGSWEGEAEVKFEEDFNLLTSAMKTAVETLREITLLAEDYVNSMKDIETAYGKNHVTMA